MTTWYRYVDDTFAFIDPKMIKIVCEKLNSFHPKILFTYELEKQNKIGFLDVLITRMDDNKLETTEYRKSTNTDIYINWFSHSPNNWKVGTFTNLVRRAVTICSTEQLLMKDLDHLKHVFVKLNQYPSKLIDNIIKKELTNKDKGKANEIDDKVTDDILVSMTLPYVGNKGEKLVKKLKQDLKSKLPVTVKTQITYRATKLGSAFQIKDQTKLTHGHNITYLGTCPECKHRYVGQTRCRCQKRVIEHNSKDIKSHLLQHANKTNHTRVWPQDFKTLGSSYSCDFKRKRL